MRTSNWAFSLLGTLLSLGLSMAAIFELYTNRSALYALLGQSSFQCWIVVGLLLASVVFFLATASIILWQPPIYRQLCQALLQWRIDARGLSPLIGVVIALVPPIVLLFTPLGKVLSGPYFRTVFWLISSLATAFFFTRSQDEIGSGRTLAFGFVLSASLHYLAIKLSAVTNYPFMLIWSEGNRFYDYSIYLGRALYIYPGQLSIPYNAPGRYLLWGLPFAIPGTPIWIHRLWDALLWTLPNLILGFLLARWSRMNGLGKWAFALWIFLFLAQGPVYPTLVLSAILIVLLVRPGKWVSSLIGAASGGYYAALSRFTWLFAPAAWTGFILLSEFRLEKGEKLGRLIVRLLPAALLVAVSVTAAALANPTLITPAEYQSGTSNAFTQPLLWYRLFPNATYLPGILLGTLIAIGPLALMLVWLVLRRIWLLNWIQALAYSVATLAFGVVGVIASVKIGGGSNLHNLDMFLVSLAIMAGLALVTQTGPAPAAWPRAARVVLALIVLVPSWNVIRSGRPLTLPDQKTIERALESAYAKTNKAQKRGEVLFLDHRQLLAFQYVRGVTLVSEYEKKFLMDQAMDGDAEYFRTFYQDLAHQRFSLIVAQPMFTSLQDEENRFPEENNAWVEWVAAPLLCYYTPVETIPEVQLQFLAPRSDPQGCP